jgi:hypothetical protein
VKTQRTRFSQEEAIPANPILWAARKKHIANQLPDFSATHPERRISCGGIA